MGKELWSFLLMPLVLISLTQCVKQEPPSTDKANTLKAVITKESDSTKMEASDQYADQILTDSTVSDIDGNIYRIVQIGKQIWMAENLKTTRYNDGSRIHTTEGGPAGYTEWFDLGEGAYCWYDNVPGYKNTYGAIYNWHSVNTRKLCPDGFHVPGEDEWTLLVKNLGGYEEPFNEMTENAKIFWDSSNNSINESGFAPLQAGCLCGWGFIQPGFWWTSTSKIREDNPVAWAYLVSFDIKSYEPASYGYSVRCLKND